MATLESLEEILQHQDARMNLLTIIADRQQTLLEQVQRDGQKTTRIWIWLCKRFGLPEDEDPQGPWDDDN